MKPLSHFHRSSSRVVRVSGAIALSALSLSLAACEPELNDVEADVDTPSEQTAVPENAEIGDGSIDVSELIGETVTISTKVTEVLSPNLFTVYDVESMRGEEVLAVTDSPIPEIGTNVEITGDVMEMDADTVEAAFSIVLEDDVKDAYTGKPYIDVQAMEAVD
ncbi:MAG: hypothetical protein ACFB16_05085 [Phormidesmis sp.]